MMNSVPDETEKSKNGMQTETRPDFGNSPVPDEQSSDVAACRTLEQIVDLTGEFEHLNELVMIHIKNSGGFSSPDAYFRIVRPVIDKLEAEIRIRLQPGMSAATVKLVIQDWIDTEIAALKKCQG
jgi:hypothetical protein